MKRYACSLPVRAKDSPKNPVLLVPVSTLAEDDAQARQLADDAGLTLVGKFDPEGRVVPCDP